MMETMGRLFTPGEIAAMECIRCLYISLLRKRAVDAQLAEDLAARAMAALQAGGTPEEVLARWLPIQNIADSVMDPAAWSAQSAPPVPVLPRGGGTGQAARWHWPPGTDR
jgi:hypothetical protein